MSAEQTQTPFLTYAYLHHSLQLKNKAHDDKEVEIIDRSNEELDNRINPYIETPVAADDPIFSHCRTAALRFAKTIWADEVLIDLERLKTYTELFDTKMEWIIKELIARRTPKTKSVLVSTDPRKAKTILPTQYKVLITDDY